MNLKFYIEQIEKLKVKSKLYFLRKKLWTNVWSFEMTMEYMKNE